MQILIVIIIWFFTYLLAWMGIPLAPYIGIFAAVLMLFLAYSQYKVKRRNAVLLSIICLLLGAVLLMPIWEEHYGHMVCENESGERSICTHTHYVWDLSHIH